MFHEESLFRLVASGTTNVQRDRGRDNGTNARFFNEHVTDNSITRISSFKSEMTNKQMQLQFIVKNNDERNKYCVSMGKENRIISQHQNNNMSQGLKSLRTSIKSTDSTDNIDENDWLLGSSGKEGKDSHWRRRKCSQATLPDMFQQSTLHLQKKRKS